MKLIVENKKDNKEIYITLFTLFVTLTCYLIFLNYVFELFISEFNKQHLYILTQIIIFTSISIFLLYGSIVYQLSRLGYLIRLKKHQETQDILLDNFAFSDKKPPSLSILIPSYKEENRVISQTIYSAVFQEYPDKNIILLIDDPPFSTDLDDQDKIKSTRGLIDSIQADFLEKANYIKSYFNQSVMNRANSARLLLTLSELYDYTADWIENEAAHWPIIDHTDNFFVENILNYQVSNLQKNAKHYKILANLPNINHQRTAQKIKIGYQKLLSLVDVKIDYFERKKHENLSWESNKAMNLNSYISLMGGKYKIRTNQKYFRLVQTKQKNADLIIPDSDYIITLDADSQLLSDYALRLIYYLNQKNNEKVAVVQTPYSSYPNSTSLLERAAAATTDIQFIIHQGFTFFNATYWVGANAVIRKKALADIKEIDFERGEKIYRYIQDRTVIEDTESTIDLVHSGWSLYNYPKRLSYSATPPDFGALLIQRRRWANGGLIIVPKLLSHLFRSLPKIKYVAGSGMMRIHYLISITLVNIGMMIVFFYPFTSELINIWLIISAIPYLYLYGRDLTLIGYKKIDLFRVYAINLLLIPINIGGVLKSVQQMIKKEKIPFGRTPKVSNRTPAPFIYIFFEYILLCFFILTASFDLLKHNWLHASFSIINLIFFIYVIRLIGFKESFKDLISPLQVWVQFVTSKVTNISFSKR